MSDPRNSGNRGIQPPAQLRSPDLDQASHQETEAGDIQSKLISGQELSGVPAGEGEGFLRQHQHQEKEHTQHKVVSVQEGQTCLPGKVADSR